MSTNRLGIMSAGLLALGAVSGAQADMITFIHESFGGGTIGQVSFGLTAPVAIKITAVADTDNIDSSLPGVLSLDHALASIEIQGVGTFDFLTGTRTFVNNGNGVVGFSRAGIGGLDLLDGPQLAIYTAWDMLSSIGPNSGEGDFTQWNDTAVDTTGGVLSFFSSPADVTFTAIVVPTPGAIALAGIACLGLRRRR